MPDFTCNGLDATSGGYLLADVPLARLIEAAETPPPADPVPVVPMPPDDPQPPEPPEPPPVVGGRDAVEIDRADVGVAGWGVVFAPGTPPEVRAALAPLLDLRRGQAGSRYREMEYQVGETPGAFFVRNGVVPGSEATPEVMPYYLLVVGDPASVPFAFQHRVDAARAVGRISFDEVDDYARYAAAVVASETSAGRPRRAVFAGTANPGDRWTGKAVDELIRPLAQAATAAAPACEVDVVEPADATKDGLVQLLGGTDRPDLLFVSSHGLGLPSDHPDQRARQGSLVAQNWPGPDAGAGPIDPAHCVAATDVADDADVAGMVVFLFACFSAGTPKHDSFAHLGVRGQSELAPSSFLARLPQRLLAHPNGGALAVAAHVDIAFGLSFFWPELGRHIGSFTEAVGGVLDGQPVGLAMDAFGRQYASLGVFVEGCKEGPADDLANPNVELLATLLTAKNDARNYAVIGDPAVRLKSPS
jgi:hypothetical protein